MNQLGTSRRYWDEAQKGTISMVQSGTSRRYIWFPKVHLGPGGAVWLCNKGATSCRSAILFTGPEMGVLIMVNYSPIWKCEYSWEPRELFQDAWMVSLNINPWGWYWSTYNEQKNIWCWIVPCRSSTISNWAPDRSCSLLIMDISLMRLLDPDEYVCQRSMSDVSTVQTERSSWGRLNWRRKMD